ncbi:phosphoadenylyl-sulfate reductase [Alphaproteobacteria bacterium GH1-50]|uniref:Adenosine 5'-phosphosulfate reductase n=1 Tax=Kangsaoukella pontilimi TaxID=2691042 RepID=A0A7C9MFC8_9RHOB|nr:phosphoadenylyl-sulfate reductase [Kangsaoukella pontilimi]MXQ07696.1 phosphoadenylyl-sulfate reductase [Kangsaoukella pontilimi]
MPLEAPLEPVATRVADLNRRHAHHAAHDVLAHALTDPQVGPTALVSSFGAEAVVLLHMVATIDRTAPVLFVDTEMLFPETLDYQADLAAKLRLSNVTVIRPDRDETFLADPENTLHVTDPDACCDLRKTRPLERALTTYGAWVTGRKRYQGGRRVALDFFEPDAAGRIKVNPLAHWSPSDVADYIDNNRLPRHPLVAKGYPSIGCLPCTTRVAEGEDSRAGRWRGRQKTECGIHVAGGRATRPAAEEAV